MYTFGPAEWQAIDVTLRLCLYTTIILLLLATPLAWWLAKGRSRGRDVVQAIVSLPLVLPPTVLGFYLLVAMGPGDTGQNAGRPGVSPSCLFF